MRDATRSIVGMTNGARLLLVLCLAGLAPAAHAQSGGRRARAGGDEKLRRAILKVEADWDDAIVRKDRAFLERLLDEDFVFIGATGAVANKEELIASATSPDSTVEPFATEDVRTRFYGDATAVVTGRFTQKGKYKGKDFKYTFRYTDVYVKRRGEWRAVSAHASLVRE